MGRCKFTKLFSIIGKRVKEQGIMRKSLYEIFYVNSIYLLNRSKISRGGFTKEKVYTDTIRLLNRSKTLCVFFPG